MDDSIPPGALLADCPPPLAAIAEELRAVVRAAVPDAVERVRTGWHLIGYDALDGRRRAYFAWVWPEQAHVHLGFVQGVHMADPERMLGGDAKLARWLTFSAGDHVDAARLVPLVREARRVALLPRVMREEARLVP
jgi:hypothetical protein